MTKYDTKFVIAIYNLEDESHLLLHCIQNDISGIFLNSKKSKCGIYRMNRLLEIEKKNKKTKKKTTTTTTNTC